MEENVHNMKSTFDRPKRPPVDIEFQDLIYAVPDGRKGSKRILRSISGKFRSGQLTAILGPSGSGKSTLLNLLAGYKCRDATGSILVNGQERNLKGFRELSRYIMQDNLVQPLLTVDEIMMFAANLKLSQEITTHAKLDLISDILEKLRLTGARTTITDRLSGGECKRLSIALELLNNPLVLFLDEPTTGLDDSSCLLCINLLKQLSEEGRTVICSIHTPSAKIYSLFDNVYVISSGQCVYQGYGPDVVPFLSSLGMPCPTSYNPADFIMEVCSGAYGDCHEKMLQAIDNGKNINNSGGVVLLFENNISNLYDNSTLYIKNNKNSQWVDFKTILLKMWKQMWRNKNHLLLKAILHMLVGFVVGNMYIGIGQDGSKTLFNFGFFFTCIIFFMYIPMMPVLLSFPQELQYLKREHFNKWYSLGTYFCAYTISTLPVQIILGTLYLSMVYIFSSQPMEIERILPFFGICFLTSFTSESFGLLVSSTLNLLNGMFVAPVMMVPFIIFSAYGYGDKYENIPLVIRILMRCSYLRYSFEALILVMLRGRKLPCPETQEYCMYTDLDEFIKVMAMNKSVLWIDVLVLVLFLIAVRSASFYLLRQRLTPNKTFAALQYIGRFVKIKFSGTVN